MTDPVGEPAADAVVLIGESGALRERSAGELRSLAAADPPNVTVVRVADDGAFATAVDWRRADAAVAVSDRGISELRVLDHENATLALRLHERRPQTVFAHLGSVGHDERQGELLLSLVNNGETPIESLSVSVASLPEGWSIAGVRGDGRYRSANRTVEWPSVAPGEEIDTTVVVAVPQTATPGEYSVGLRVASATHAVAVENETVEVRPAETPGPTTAPPATNGDAAATTAGGDESPTGTTATAALSETTDPGGTSATGDGFGIATAIAGAATIAAAAVVFGHSRLG